eukprot:PhM_4_TR9982/c0_g1_i1/m.67875
MVSPSTCSVVGESVGFLLLAASTAHGFTLPLPDRVPMEFGLDGSPKRFVSPTAARLLLPGYAVVICGFTRWRALSRYCRGNRTVVRGVNESVPYFLAYLHSFLLRSAASGAPPGVRRLLSSVYIPTGLYVAFVGVRVKRTYAGDDSPEARRIVTWASMSSYGGVALAGSAAALLLLALPTAAVPEKFASHVCLAVSSVACAVGYLRA